MKARILPLVTLLTSLAVPLANAATTIVSDSFDDGDIADGTDPSDVEWSVMSNNNTPSYGTSAPVPGTGGYLDSGMTTSTFRGVKGQLPVSPLLNLTNVGDSITLSFKFLYSTDPTGSGGVSGGFRMGLMTSAGLGTGLFAGTGTNDGLRIERDALADGLGGSSFGGGGFNQGNFAGPNDVANNSTMTAGINTGAVYTASLTITRASANSLTFSGSLNGGTATAIDFDDTPDTDGTEGADFVTNYSGGFIVMRNGSQNGNFRIDDVLVTAVPEPGSVLMASLGLLAFLRRHR